MLKKSNGFSLIETMVAMGIMTVGLLGILQILTMQMKVSNTTKLDSEVANTVFLVNAVLKNSTACKENIGNFGKVSLPVAAGQKVPVNALNYPSGGGPLVTIGTNTPKTVALKEMNLTNFKLLSSFGGFNIISSELEMLFNKPDGIGSTYTKRKVSLQLRANGAGAIVDCSGEGTELTDFQLHSICSSNGGVFDFPTKKCKLPEPPIPPPQIIVQQIPVPAPAAPATTAANSNPKGGGGGSASASSTPSSSTSAPSTPTSVASTPPPVINIPPAAPPPPPPAGPALYSVVNPYCENVGLITTSSTCNTRSYGVDGQGSIQFYSCNGKGGGILYDAGDTCPNARL